MKTAPSIAGTWHLRQPDALARDLQTNLEGGLSDHEAQQRLEREGPNELPEVQPPSLLKLFLSQFTSVIVWVLIGAAVISGLLEDWLDAAAILAIVNALWRRCGKCRWQRRGYSVTAFSGPFPHGN
jgi:Ca2+-transporting ATPase